MSDEARTGVVSAKGNPLTLLGPELKVGEKAPDFELRSDAMEQIDLSLAGDGVRIFVIVPSLDTGVCEAETKRFNSEAGNIGNAKLVVVSRDLPFAMKRFCAAHNTDKVTIYSDFDKASLGKAWGLYIAENGLLARAVVILDGDNVVRYVQVVPELTSEPDYDDVLAKAKEIAG